MNFNLINLLILFSCIACGNKKKKRPNGVNNKSSTPVTTKTQDASSSSEVSSTNAPTNPSKDNILVVSASEKRRRRKAARKRDSDAFFQIAASLLLNEDEGEKVKGKAAEGENKDPTSVTQSNKSSADAPGAQSATSGPLAEPATSSSEPDNGPTPPDEPLDNSKARSPKTGPASPSSDTDLSLSVPAVTPITSTPTEAPAPLPAPEPFSDDEENTPTPPTEPQDGSKSHQAKTEPVSPSSDSSTQLSVPTTTPAETTTATTTKTTSNEAVVTSSSTSPVVTLASQNTSTSTTGIKTTTLTPAVVSLVSQNTSTPTNTLTTGATTAETTTTTTPTPTPFTSTAAATPSVSSLPGSIFTSQNIPTSTSGSLSILRLSVPSPVCLIKNLWGDSKKNLSSTGDGKKEPVLSSKSQLEDAIPFTSDGEDNSKANMGDVRLQLNFSELVDEGDEGQQASDKNEESKGQGDESQYRREPDNNDTGNTGREPDSSKTGQDGTGGGDGDSNGGNDRDNNRDGGDDGKRKRERNNEDEDDEDDEEYEEDEEDRDGDDEDEEEEEVKDGEKKRKKLKQSVVLEETFFNIDPQEPADKTKPLVPVEVISQLELIRSNLLRENVPAVKLDMENLFSGSEISSDQSVSMEIIPLVWHIGPQTSTEDEIVILQVPNLQEKVFLECSEGYFKKYREKIIKALESKIGDPQGKGKLLAITYPEPEYPIRKYKDGSEVRTHIDGQYCLVEECETCKQEAEQDRQGRQQTPIVKPRPDGSSPQTPIRLQEEELLGDQQGSGSSPDQTAASTPKSKPGDKVIPGTQLYARKLKTEKDESGDSGHEESYHDAFEHLPDKDEVHKEGEGESQEDGEKPADVGKSGLDVGTQEEDKQDDAATGPSGRERQELKQTPPSTPSQPLIELGESDLSRDPRTPVSQGTSSPIKRPLAQPSPGATTGKEDKIIVGEREGGEYKESGDLTGGPIREPLGDYSGTFKDPDTQGREVPKPRDPDTQGRGVPKPRDPDTTRDPPDQKPQTPTVVPWYKKKKSIGLLILALIFLLIAIYFFYNASKNNEEGQLIIEEVKI